MSQGEGQALPGTARLLEEKLTWSLIIRQTFSVFFSNIASFGLVTITVLSPVILLQAYSGYSGYSDTSPELQGAAGGMMVLLSLVLSPILTGALTYGVFEVIRDHEVSIGELFRIGVLRLGPVLLVGLAQGILMMLGLILCVVPGLIVLCALAVAVPAAVIERVGVNQAIQRSRDLTKGFRRMIFSVLGAIGLMNLLGQGFLAAVHETSFALWLSGDILIQIIAPGLSATAGALLYYHLRSEKEALDVEAIAEIFA